MKAPKPVFVCQECGAQSPKWQGRCTDCGAWNSFVEERAGRDAAGAGRGRTATRMPGSRRRARSCTPRSKRRRPTRLSTGIGEFDRVLGGGIVPGSLVLLGGEPGIGKSTLLLQAAAHFARTVGPVLYASGEESEHQIKIARRSARRRRRAAVSARRNLHRAHPRRNRAALKPALVIVDSVQTVFSLKFQSAPGSIGQVREAATQFLFTAKGQNIPTVPRRPRHEGRQPRRPQGARARRRHGALLRRRAAPLAPRRARGEEPVRRRQRARRVRDDGRRPAAGAEPVEAVSGRAAVERRRGRPCCAASKARGRFSSRCRRSSARAPTATRGAWRSASTRIGLSLLLAVLEKRAGLTPGGRRRVRQHRRRHERSTSRRPT